MSKYRVLLGLFAIGFSGSLLVLGGFILYLGPQLPAVESLKDFRYLTPLRVYSKDHKLIGEFGEKRRLPIRLEETPPLYIQALLAIEDEHFFSHSGVSIRGILRSLVNNLRAGNIQGGGSTITMQVARNAFPEAIGFQQTYFRKIREIFLALQIERELSKTEILEIYINQIYFGKRAYGIQAAARVYYGKDVAELNLAQLAMLAGIPKGPSTMNPIANPSRALMRRNYILQRMQELSYIDGKSYQNAVLEPVSASYHDLQLEMDAPYVAEMARQKAVEWYGEATYTAGYKIYTTVDSRLQAAARQAVTNGLMSYDWRHGYRGPEMTLTSARLSGSEAVNELDLSTWRQTLESISRYAGLEPAAVTRVNSKNVEAVLSDGRIIRIDWESGLSDARAYLTVNARAARPRSAADVLQIGDVIRVNSHNGAWHLRQLPLAQAALVALDPENGAIISLIGGLDYRQSSFNRATQAVRQPGSNFKPFIYTAALENGYTAATLVNNAPVVFHNNSLEGAWRPVNDGENFSGPTRLREALYRSLNSVSIRVLQEVGIAKTIASLSRFGFDVEYLPANLTLALGSHALTPLQIATAYTVFANGGFQVEPYLIDSVLDSQEREIYKAKPVTVCRKCEKRAVNTADLPRAPRVLDERVAYIIDSMLRDVISKGTGKRALALGRHDLAGKTGTTNGPRDTWFSGYTGRLVTTVWLGFDQNLLLGDHEYGGRAALPIWMDYMREALPGMPETVRELPDGLVAVSIDSRTGKRAAPGSDNAIYEFFRADRLVEIPGINNSGTYTDKSGEENLPTGLFN